MVTINGVKFACDRCIRGHRVSGCTHIDQPLRQVKKKGRPPTQGTTVRRARSRSGSAQRPETGGPYAIDFAHVTSLEPEEIAQFRADHRVQIVLPGEAPVAPAAQEHRAPTNTHATTATLPTYSPVQMQERSAANIRFFQGLPPLEPYARAHGTPIDEVGEDEPAEDEPLSSDQVRYKKHATYWLRPTLIPGDGDMPQHLYDGYHSVDNNKLELASDMAVSSQDLADTLTPPVAPKRTEPLLDTDGVSHVKLSNLY